MKKNLFLITALFFQVCLSAQNFTWVKGSNLSGGTGVYGTMGVSSPLNNPGGRHGCATWVDANGDLWLFGGEGYSTSSSLSWLNDLWKYDISSNEWTWVRGSNGPNAVGIYGTQGVAASTNEPGAREFMASWVDGSGNFWLFGGDGFASTTTQGRLGDLWKYNPTTNQWTWMKGFNTVTQNGVYGTLGTPAPTNMPGTRYGPSFWKDNAGNLFLFGGRGLPASGGQGHLNDLWKYNISTNEWTWIHGSNATFQNGVYGTMGVSNASNMPGGRYHPTSFDDGAGNVFMFGGLGLPASPGGPGYLNDLWKYNITLNEWTWLSGTNQENQPVIYGPLAVSTATARPGGRYSAAGWVDLLGDLWLFGGHGTDASTLIVTGDLNDMWKFDTGNNQWTWMRGSNTLGTNGTYGTMGVPAPANMPGGRQYNTRWTDQTGKFWLFGGEGYDASNTNSDHMNDLWGYTIPCNPDSITIAPGKSICSGSTVTLTAHNTYSSSVLWYTSPTIPLSVGNGSVYTTAPLTAVSGSSVYSYFAESNGCGATPRTMITVTVNALPQMAITGPTAVCIGNSVVLTASGADTYTWNTNAQTTTVSVTPTGTLYTAYVLGTSTAGCENSTSHTLITHALPTLTITPPYNFFCRQIVYTLTLSGANTYTWNNTVVGPTFTVSGPSYANTSTVTAKGEDINGCTDTIQKKINVFLCESVNELINAIKVQVYPNPNNGEFVVNAEGSTPLTLLMYNTLGQVVYTKELRQENDVIRPVLTPGIYTYRISSYDKSATGKIVIE